MNVRRHCALVVIISIQTFKQRTITLKLNVRKKRRSQMDTDTNLAENPNKSASQVNYFQHLKYESEKNEIDLIFPA